MATPSPSAVDPVFAEIAKALYGDIDARELEALAKFSPGGSDLHVDGTMTPKQRAQREKKVALTGVGATTVATAGGLHALSATRHEHLQRMANAGSPKAAAKLASSKVKTEAKAARRVERVATTRGPAGKVLRAVARNPKRAAIAAGTGWAGLHAVELGADALAFRAQGKAIREANRTIHGKRPVSKAFRLKPLNVLPDRVPSLKAKRVKLAPPPGNPITTAGIYQPPKRPLGKGLRSAVKGGRATLRHVKSATEHADEATKQAAEATAKINRLIPKPRTAALAAGGTVGLLAGIPAAGSYAGSYAGSRHRSKKLAPVRKSELADVTWTGEIAKVDTERRQVFGWASVSAVNGQELVDLQGDVVPIEEMEKSAYRYVIDSRKGGDMHKRVAKADEPLHTADMIESFVVTPEKLEKMGLPPDALPHGWWVGYHVNDDAQWAMVKSGERKGFSIHGKGQRTAVAKRARNRAMETTPEGVVKPARRAKLNPLSTPLHSSDSGVKAANKVRLKLHRWTPEVHALGRLGPGGIGQLVGLVKADSLRDRAERAAEKVGRAKSTTISELKQRASQAAHPPPVKLRRVPSTAINAMGYQPQTRRLSVEMRSRPGQPYEYKMKRGAATDAITAPSKGHHYATEVRGKAKRAKGYSVADRARLFLKPQVSKSLVNGGPPRTRLPGDNRDAQQARTRRTAGLGTAGVGYLVADRAKSVAPGAAEWITPSAKKIGKKPHKALIGSRAKKITRVGRMGGAALIGTGLVLAGEGAVNDLRNRGSFGRTKEQVKRKVSEKVHKSAFGVEDDRLAKAFDSEQSRHSRQDIYAGGATGGAVLAGAGAVQVGRGARATGKRAKTQAAAAAATKDAVRDRLARLSQPAKTGGEPRTTKYVRETARLHRESGRHAGAAVRLAGKSRRLTRVSIASGLGAAALGGGAAALHDYDRRRGGRSYGY